MNLTSATSKLFLSSIIATVIAFGGIVYFSKVLGASGLGLYFIFITLVHLSGMVVDLGLNKSLEKRISQGEARGETIGSTLLLKGILLSLFSVVVISIGGRINEYADGEIAMFLLVGVLVHQIDRLIQSILRADHRVGETAILRVIRQFTWFSVSVALTANGWDARALVVASLCGNLASVLAGLYKIDRTVALPSTARVKSLFSFSKYAFVSRTGGHLYNWTDVFILGFFVSNSLIGAYEGAWRISGIALLLSRSISTTVFPEVSSWTPDEREKNIAKLFKRFSIPVLFLTVPAVFGSYVIGGPLLAVLYTPEFRVADLALVIFVAEKVVHSVHLLLGQIIQGMDRPDITAKASLVSIFVNVGGNLLLIPAFGITGAAIATSISHVMNTTMLYSFMRRLWVIRFPVNEISWCFLSAALMTLVLQLVVDESALDTIPEVFAVILFGAALYIGVSLVYRPIRVLALDTATSLVSV